MKKTLWIWITGGILILLAGGFFVLSPYVYWEKQEDEGRQIQEEKSSLLGKAFSQAIRTVASAVLGSTASSRSDGAFVIDRAWSGGFVPFDALQDAAAIYIAYYDASRKMSVARYDTLSGAVSIKRLENTYAGWDSHNYLTLAIDRWNTVHLAGNMHASRLIYARTTTPGAFNTLTLFNSMIGRDEQMATYPQFTQIPNGNFAFTYRDGFSSNGTHLINGFNGTSWARLLATPLFAPAPGEASVNAYPTDFTLGPDGYYHVAWTWRAALDSAANFDVYYAKSKNLVDWKNAAGAALSLPITPTNDNTALVDTIPTYGGLINPLKLGFDAEGRAVITYAKYDGNPSIPPPTCASQPQFYTCDKSKTPGASQVYNARFEKADTSPGEWRIYQMTDWSSRLNFGGGGSGASAPGEYFGFTALATVNGSLVQFFNHWGPGTVKGYYTVSSAMTLLAKTVNPAPLPSSISATPENPSTLFRVKILPVRQRDTGKAVEYYIRWETEAANRDVAWPCTTLDPQACNPPPSELRLYRANAVSITSPPPPVCTLSVSPVTVVAGNPVTLSWTSVNAHSGLLDNGLSMDSITKGSKTLYPIESTAYMGTVVGGRSIASCSTSVTVTFPAPVPASIVSLQVPDSAAARVGTAIGDPAYIAGRIGNALQFDGIDDYITMGDQDGLEGLSQISIAFWVKLNELSETPITPIAKSSVYRFTIYPGNVNWVAATEKNAWYSSGTNVRANQSIKTGQWYHIAGIYDGGGVRLYINGVLAQSGPRTLGGNLLGNANPFVIGHKSAANVASTHGAIDDVRVYSRALNADEISLLANAASDTALPNSLLSGLLSHWKLDIPTPSLGSEQEPFQESEGRVIVEAEHYDTRVARNSQSWMAATAMSGYSGDGYVEAQPNKGIGRDTGYAVASPEANYRVNFTKIGTYTVWVRGFGPSYGDDSVHIGMDGKESASSDRLQLPTSGQTFNWSTLTLDSRPATIVVDTPGIHIVDLWMREDGARIDKLLLTTDSTYVPSGAGPAESTRGAQTVTPIQTTTPIPAFPPPSINEELP